LKQRTIAEYERGIERCQLDCSRLEEAVAKMLTLARLETPVESPSSASADLAQCVRQVAEQYASMAELRRQRIVVTAEAAVMVEVEPEQLALLCSNLLQNAIQHSPEGADIRAVVRQDGELVMEDDGDGIAAEDLPHVFDRFYRGDPSRSRNTGGTGLGLAICKAIVTRFQGTIAIDSEPHVGTRVKVRFPRARALQHEQAFMPAELHERR
jgi:signal transduction histidine kinase